MPPRIYLDHAATSWPKRPEVAAAMMRALDLGTNYGRGQSRTADEVRRVVDRCRSRLAELFGVNSPDRVAFTSGGTDGLNTAIYGYLSPGDRVVTTAMEHNSVLRPLTDLRDRCGVSVEIVRADARGFVDVEAFAAACREPVQLAVINHASNVTGALQPVAELAESARATGARVLLDACQTAGHIDVNIEALGVDVLATSGHKGLGGPLGVGLLVMADRCDEVPRPMRLGGTGGQSESLFPPAELPARFEAGSLNVPGIFGLEAAIASLRIGIGDFRWIDALSSIPGVTLHGPESTEPRVGVASITVDGWEPHDLATVLESEFGIETRAGLHCAPLAHQTIGTLETGGTVRFSPCGSAEGEPDWVEQVRSVVG